MKWFKTAKQKQAEIANLHFDMMKLAGEVHVEGKNETKKFFVCSDPDVPGDVQFWAATPHDLYDVLDDYTEKGIPWTADLKGYVINWITGIMDVKTSNMTDIMSQPIVVVMNKRAEPMVVPYRYRMIDHGNDQWSIGEVN